MSAQFCGVTGALGGGPFGPAALVDLPGGFDGQLRDALELVRQDGGAWQIDTRNAYLPTYILSVVGSHPRMRIVSLAPISPVVVRAFESQIRGLPADLAASLGIVKAKVSSSASRAWMEVDWDGLLDPQPAIARRELDPNTMFDELVSVLQRLARHGAVHGGIEPVHLRRRTGQRAAQNGSLCLMHFGLPPLLAAQRKAVFPALGTSAGDPRYMAPEVAFGLPPGPEADWYAAAASFVELLSSSGKASAGPLMGLSGARARAERSPEEWLSRIDEDLRSRLEGRVIEQLWLMLEPHPAHRRLPGAALVPEEAPPRADERRLLVVRSALELRRAQEVALAAGTSAASDRSPGDTKRRARRAWWCAGSAACLVLLTVGGSFVVSSVRPTPPIPVSHAPGEPTLTPGQHPPKVEKPIALGPPAPEPCDLEAAVAIARRALAFGVVLTREAGEAPTRLAPIACARVSIDQGTAPAAKAKDVEEHRCCEAVAALHRCAEEHGARPLLMYRLPESSLARQRVAQLRQVLQRCGMESSLVPVDVSGLDVIMEPLAPR
ncbi:MAG: hypothetical protein IT372_28820 [Polyangiaceae bacterium]|nr:hypothetical protein [Polyangiaceae bacterium]